MFTILPLRQCEVLHEIDMHKHNSIVALNTWILPVVTFNSCLKLFSEQEVLNCQDEISVWHMGFGLFQWQGELAK